MNASFVCQNAHSLSSRLSSNRLQTSKLMMPVLALLALLCGMTVSAHAQSTAYYAGVTSAVSTGYFTDAEGMATDATGNLYVAATNGTTWTVYEIARTGVDTYSTATPVALPTPAGGYCASATAPCLRGVAFDSLGNLWVAAFNGGTGGQVYELTPTAGSFASSTPTAVGTGWVSPWGIAADASGNVFVTDYTPNTVTKITGGSLTVVNTGGVTAPRGIANDGLGNLFVVNGNKLQVQEIVAPGYTTVNTVSAGISGAGDDAFDANGNLWVSAYGSNSATELSGWDTVINAFGTVQNWGSGLNGPVAVWPSIDGTMLVSDTAPDGSINQINLQQPRTFASTLGASSALQTVTFAFTASTTIASVNVVSQGAAGQDFVNAGTGSCTAATFTTTCTVDVQFAPKTPGNRAGAVELVDGSGNVAEAFLSGSATGPEVVFSPNLGNQLLASLASPGVPQKLVVDGSGNIFVVDSNLGKIFKIAAGGGTPTQIAPTYSGTPYGIAIDGAGNLFVGDTSGDTVSEILAPAYTTIIGLPHVFAGSPAGLAVDASGNLYVAESPGGGTAAVEELTAVSGYSALKTFTSSLANPFGIAVDASGNVFVADHTAGGSITEFTAGAPVGTFGSFTAAESVAVDAAGNLYVADNSSGAITELTKASGYATAVTLFTSPNAPVAVALDNTGNVYYSTNASDDAVYEIQLAAPGSLAFGTTNPYQTQSAAQAVTFSNIGNADLTFTNDAAVPTDFTVGHSAGDCFTGVSVTSGGSCALSVTFTPASVGTLVNGTATLTDNAVPSPQTITLSGTGTQATATVVAQDAAAGYSAIAQNVTLTATVTATGVADINEGTVAFTVQGTAGGTVTSPTIVNGAASVTYVIPAGQAAGPYTIQAAYTDASGNFTSSTDTTHKLTIGLANQSTLTVSVSSPATYNTSQTLTTTGGNGTGAVTYSVGASTACSVSGATLTITSGTGTCAVTATKAGDTNYNPISSTPPTPVTVQTAAQSPLTVSAMSPAAYNSTQTLTASGGSGTGALTFSAGLSTACSVTGTTLTITSGTGTCLVTATRAADNNYSALTSPTVTVTVQMINQSPLVVHATSPATYNTTQPLTTTGGNGTGAVTFSAAGSTACSVTGSTLTITSGTGTCSVTATKAADANYNAVSSVAATVTVQTAAQSALTVSATSPAAYNSTQTLTATGGSGTGALTFSAAGSTACSVTGSTLTITSGTGTCLVTATKAADNNYSSITSAAVTVTVQPATQATLTLTAASPAVYNTTQTLTTTGGSGTGAVTFSAGGSTACSVTGTTLTITAGTGTCSLTATKAADSNYSVATATATVTVSPATLTIVVNSASRAYGAANPTFTGTVTGLLNGDAVTTTYSTTATVTSPVGTYPITATISGAKAANYTATVTAGTLTVGKAGLTIVVNNATRVYNTANPTFTGTVTGLLNGDAVTTTYSTTATLASPVGTYPITATISGGASGNYTATVTAGTLTITQATTTVTWAAPAAIIYGTPLSATQLDATANVGGSFVYTPAAGTVLAVGTNQALSVAFTPTDAVDYKSATGATTITVAASGLTVSANNATRVYGTANPTFTGTITGAQSGDTFTESFTTSATITSNAGTYAIVPSATGTHLANYTVVVDNGTLTITKANSTTGLSASGSSVNPGATVTLTATVASATSGTPTGTVSFYDGTTLLGTGTLTGGVATYATTTLTAGVSHTLTATYGGDVNFNGSSTTTSTDITVGVLDFTLGTPSPATQTGSSGTAFTYAFSITPTYTNYAGTVNFTATGLPAGTTATFSPATIAANGGAQNVTLILATAAGSAALVHPSTAGRGLIPVALAFLFLPLVGTKRMRREGRRFGRLACMLLLVLAGLGATAALTGCGSHSGGSTTGQSYTVTITATSGAIQHTATVTLDLK